MNAVEYLSEKARASDSCKKPCKECPLSTSNNGFNVPCPELENNHPEIAVSIMEKWAKENPKRTYKDVLLEKFPNAKIYGDGTPLCCNENVTGVIVDCNTVPGCKECWNQEYKE